MVDINEQIENVITLLQEVVDNATLNLQVSSLSHQECNPYFSARENAINGICSGYTNKRFSEAFILRRSTMFQSDETKGHKSFEKELFCIDHCHNDQWYSVYLCLRSQSRERSELVQIEEEHVAVLLSMAALYLLTLFPHSHAVYLFEPSKATQPKYIQLGFAEFDNYDEAAIVYYATYEQLLERQQDIFLNELKLDLSK
ncbi:hypothetical protein [Vibrio vulnificus]|uniref:hypothetical protein n=1 Tax=Vibrio vulnificus TaxID=672 RepID=UPI0005F14CB4|nr:hypothetical protein [Vibrio vulnificus]POB18748.1 hypothetical protein CRN36_07145 [Vibrio vulnificus]